MRADILARKSAGERGSAGEQFEIWIAGSGGHDAFIPRNFAEHPFQLPPVVPGPMRAQSFACAADDEFRAEARVVFEPSLGCALNDDGSEPGQERKAQQKSNEEFKGLSHDRNYLNARPFVVQSKSVTFSLCSSNIWEWSEIASIPH